MHKYIIVRQLIYSYKTFALFLSRSLQSKKCLAKSSTAKVRQICQEYLDEFSTTPARDLRCNLCDVLVKCDKKFFVESHRKSKQTFLQLDQVNFKKQVVSSFLAADIPLHKLNHPS